LIPLSRYDVNCHTLLQIIVGVILGFVIGFIYYIIERRYLRKYERFANDRIKFYKWILG